MNRELIGALAGAVGEEELIRNVCELVRIPSYLGLERQEEAAALYLKALFDGEGIPCELTYADDGRPNIVATLKGEGGGRSLLLNGHTDTVNLDNMPGGVEPFIENGRLYGRGASDMKGPDICMAMALVGMKRAGIKLRGDLIFAGSADEEMCSIGTIDLIQRGLKADGAIIGEPTEFAVCTAHRGLEWYEFIFTGRTVHGGSQAEGVNAILKANKFINAVEAELIPAVFAKKHPILKEATLNIGIIHGGTGLSTVPGKCTLWIDRRFLPYEDYYECGREFQRIIDRLAADDPDFKCEMKVMDVSVMREGFVHLGMETDRDDPIVKTVSDAAFSVLGADAPGLSFFPAWTDAGLIKGYAGIPSVVFGPGLISCCHSETEYMPVDHLVKGYLAYALAAADFCGAEK